jgi:uncharacterized membrane protein YphA (DoxX/SURF4 family)
VLECAYVPSQFRFPVIEVKQLRADNFITTALFYLILSSLPGRYSFDHWVAKPKPNDPQSLGFWSRVLQVHLCLIYFISGLAKFLGNGRWDGSNPWRSLIRPPFNLVSPDLGFTVVMIVMNLAALGVPSTGRRAQETSATTGQ